MAGRRILVTGGLGFIGAHLVNRLAAREDVAGVVVLDARLHQEGNISEALLGACRKLELHIGNVVDQNLTRRLAQDCELIYHLAAETHVQRSIHDPEAFVHANVLGTLSVLEAARASGCRLVHASTSEVYGDVRGEMIDENTRFDAYSPYAASKLAADGLVQAYVRTYGINARVLRMFNVFGPGQYFEKLIPMLICSSLCGLPMPIQGDGAGTRDWSYVGDVIARLESLLTAWLPIPICNLGSGESFSVSALVARVASLAGRADAARIAFPERSGHVARQVADVRATHRHFGPNRYSVDQGLARSFQWYSQHSDVWRANFLRVRPRILAGMGEVATSAIAAA